MTDENVIYDILKEYEDKRTKAARDRKKRIEKVNEAYPRLGEIDFLIEKYGIENTNRILRDPVNKEKYNQALREKFQDLTTEREKIMTQNHIAQDYKKYEYQCMACSDTGYTPNGKRCQCFEQKLLNAAYAGSNISETLKKENFDTFSFAYFSRETPTGHTVSPYVNMTNILKRCKDFCEHFSKTEKSLYFYGMQGLGKTFLSSCIAKALIDNGKTVIYMRATRLFMMYDDYKFGKVYDRKVIDKLYQCDLLIIDDLGTEVVSKNTYAFLFDLMNERIANGKKFVISTNLDMKEFTKIYSTRLTSRIYESFDVLKFYGSDIRIQKVVK